MHRSLFLFWCIQRHYFIQKLVSDVSMFKCRLYMFFFCNFPILHVIKQFISWKFQITFIHHKVNRNSLKPIRKKPSITFASFAYTIYQQQQQPSIVQCFDSNCQMAFRRKHMLLLFRFAAKHWWQRTANVYMIQWMLCSLICRGLFCVRNVRI